MVHIVLHFLVPIVVALLFYKKHWQHAALILVATMLVDLDHLFADPIYDPERCSIGFHPLHTIPAIMLYTILFTLPFITGINLKENSSQSLAEKLHLIGLGLLLHMALDGIDCLF